MKKILTRKEREGKESRNKIIIGVILVILMILSVTGYAFLSSPDEGTEEIEYNGVEFVLSDTGRWQFVIQNFGFSTLHTPKETENISAPIFTTINNYGGKPLFFVGESAAKQEIALNLQNFVLRMQDACLEGQEGCEEWPIKNCSEDNIIILKEADYIEIREEDNCVFLESSLAEQTKVADAFLFKILGIKNF
jgi:hypothetical protein